MNSRGFTLIELLVALVVLGILLSIGMPAFGKIIDQQRMDSGLGQRLVDVSGYQSQRPIRRRRTAAA